MLTPGEPSGFNPLVLPDSGENREFLYQLCAFMLRRQDGRDLGPKAETVIRAVFSETLQDGS